MKYLFFSIMIFMVIPTRLLASEPDPNDLKTLAKRLNAAQIKEYEALAQKNNSRAQLIVGLLKAEEAVKMGFNDPAKLGEKEREAATWYRKAAEQGYAPAQYFLAKVYEEQKGYALDCDEVNKWLDKAVGADYRAALSYKAFLYETQRCAEQDYVKAMALYKKASSLGYGWASSRVAEFYSAGRGVVKDEKEANVWYMIGAENGSSSAQNELGIRISEGIGTESNNPEAVKWFQKSAEQGNVFGACNLALHYARGQGVAKNTLLSLKWMYISHALDGLKCFPNDFIEFLKTSKAIDNQAWNLAVTWLRQHPDLENEFNEKPWVKSSNSKAKANRKNK